MQFSGSKWWKVDFHTHTPGSTDYRDLSVSCREWLLKYMEKEIDCVVVTDHNSGKWIDPLKIELLKMREEQVDGFREIVIFPGVEITVNGGIHLLAILDVNKGSDDITRLMGAVDYDGTPGNSDGITSKPLSEVIKIVNSQGGISIPAHVNDVKGLFQESQGMDLERLLKSEYLLSLEVTIDDYDYPQVYKNSGLNLSEVLGSDSHSLDTIGIKYTWIKMETPTLQALVLALHDGEDGVKKLSDTDNNPNDTEGKFYIKSISIKEGAKAGRGGPLNLNFSPWMNSIIGGRGSGKSSVLEYMRLPFNNVHGLPDKINESFKSFNKVPPKRGETGMLTENTEVEVELRKDKRDIKLIWNNNNIKELHKNEESQWELQPYSTNINERFPIKIYSQKQLYELTEDPNHIMNIIDDQWDKISWNEKKDYLEEQFLNVSNVLRRLEISVSEKGDIQNKIKDVKARISVFDSSYYQNILKEYNHVETINNLMIKNKEKISTINKEMRKLVELTSESIFQEEELSNLDETSSDLIVNLSSEYNELKELMLSFNDKFIAFNNRIEELDKEFPWNTHKVKIIDEYNSLVSQLKEDGHENPNLYQELLHQKSILDIKLDKISEDERLIDEMKDNQHTVFKEIEEHQFLLRTKREEIISNWVGESDIVRIHLMKMGDKEKAEQDFRNIIRKNDNTFAKVILDKDDSDDFNKGIIYDISVAENPFEERSRILNRLTEIDSDESEFGKLFSRHILNLKSNTPEDLDKLKIWYPEDEISLKMLTDNRREEDIATGSVGQRTAAILSLLLRAYDTPIILDQPEEDLDTQRISDLVVKDFRKLKLKQQIIVITHNPNIPVNGGAENIIQMDFARGQIYKKLEGALQSEDIRDAVCTIMEGGKEALDKRYFRVSKSMSDN